MATRVTIRRIRRWRRIGLAKGPRLLTLMRIRFAADGAGGGAADDALSENSGASKN